MTIKVLHITSRADTGGGPKHVLDLTSTTAKDHHQFEIYIASPNEPPFSAKYQEVAKKWLEIPKRRVCLKSLLEIRKFYKENSIDIVHSHGRGAGYFSRFL